jgi:hypothetical protein
MRGPSSARLSPDVSQCTLNPALVPAQAVVLGLVDPSDGAVLVDQQCGRDRHSLETGWIPECETENEASYELETVSMDEPVVLDDLKIWIRQDGERETIPLLVCSSVFDGVFADGDGRQPIALEERLHSFEPL